nr:PREDICTED: protein msta-like [Bemisia tabaci]XP_018907166.1 PREDICTED: protein msta-like [Bemisia tabaci]
MSNQCATCGEEAKLLCSGCHSLYYCGREHQKKHWKTHKPECTTFRLEYSPTMGRYVVANRDIKQGEIILKEKPIVLGPKIASLPVCLGCNRRLKATAMDDDDPLEYYKCSKCGWPLCAPRCEDSPNHRDECKLMSERNYRSPIQYQDSPKKESSYCCITPLRCLLLPQKEFQRLSGLQSHLDERINTPLYKILKTNLVMFIREVLGLKQFDERTILNVAGILDTNAFEIRRNMGNVKIRGLYPRTAMLSHNCKPNTKHVFAGEDFELSLMATVDIKKDEIISATYTQTLWPTLDRRAHLKMSKCFDCSCERCADATEFNTFLSAIKCSKCKNYVISTEPLNRLADWQCTSCSKIFTAKQISLGNDALKKELQSLDKSSPSQLEHFLESYLTFDGVLHENNCHVLEAKYALCQIYGNMLSELSDDQLTNKINLCNDILEVANILEPGITKLRGVLLYDMQAAMAVLTKKLLESEKITAAQADASMRQVISVLQDAAVILKTDPDLGYLLKDKVKDLSDLCE